MSKSQHFCSILFPVARIPEQRFLQEGIFIAKTGKTDHEEYPGIRSSEFQPANPVDFILQIERQLQEEKNNYLSNYFVPAYDRPKDYAGFTLNMQRT
jgi:hypothetical protein